MRRFKPYRSAVCAALCLLGTTSASATLLDRGPDMVYDDVLKITWTRQAGDGVGRNWADANAWAAGLVFGGKDDWRLPWASVSATAGPAGAVYFCLGDDSVADEAACRGNEMGYMLYYNLDANLGDDKTGTQTALGGEVLTGIQRFYWSGTEFNFSNAWNFNFSDSLSPSGNKLSQLSAWAVRDGDVPEPATLALLGLGLAGLGFSRRKKSVQA